MAIKKTVKIPAKKQVEFDVVCVSHIGKEVEIVDASNKLQIGVIGILVFESANLLHIEVDGLLKKFLKNGLVIKFDYEAKNILVDCSVLSGNLVSRIKKIK